MNSLLPLKTQIHRHAAAFRALLPEKFSLDDSQHIDVGGRMTPVLMHGRRVLNLDHAIPDGFTARTGVTTTIFVKTGADFIRVSTSIKSQAGERAVGTALDRAHPAHARLLSGKSYLGLASVFGAQLMTRYDPIIDARGRLIGAVVVGLDITQRPYANLSAKLTAAVLVPVSLVLLLYAWMLGDAYSSLVVPMAGGAQHAVPASAGAMEDALAAIRYRAAAGAAGALLLLGGALYFFIRRTVSLPLRQARAAAEKLAAGDLTTLLHVDRRDELGDLMHATNSISQGLARLVGEVRQGSDQITLASREIATGNADLSSRTEEQASSLAATASETEKLAAMVRQTADHATEVNAHAMAAGRVAAEGGQMVEQVMRTMSAIKISSLRIADVIDVVNGIAFQTNILALNAAVEAARAGEQGRGFAVVASEVRALAQRSAAAAKEVKELIDTSVANVDEGEKLVAEAGRTMSGIIASVERVSGIIEEVNGASHAQSRGVEQVNGAVHQMDQMTQQNAALVEEAAAAAQSLHDQAVKLSKAVSVFKLAGASGKR